MLNGSLATGKVKWWNDKKGYGFIEGAGGKDIFVHYTSILLQGRKSLIDHEMVSFELSPGPRGPCAKRVSPLVAYEDEAGEMSPKPSLDSLV